jgi:hypothetical protein
MSYGAQNRTKAARVIRAAFGVKEFRRELPSYAAMMLGAIDGARIAVHATIEPHAIDAGKMATVRGAHAVFLTTNGGFAALQACTLGRVETPAADALPNALLLVFATLVDGCGMALHGSWSRCCLRKADG